MAKAYLSLGSNIGDKKKYIDKAIELLNRHKKITVIKSSSYYETEPVGYTEQDLFLNIVVEISTNLEPWILLEYCNNIEEKLERKRNLRWGPRTIDVDILLYENCIINDEKLIIPHPLMEERAFVMIPLYEIAQDIVKDGKKIEDIIRNLDFKGIRKLNYKNS